MKKKSINSKKSFDESEKTDLAFKIIVIGDPGVGKSCLTGRATKNIFNAEYSNTIGFEFLTFNMNLDNKKIKLQIWDTCGQEVYKSLITNFYRNASLAMIVFAINSRQSFINVNSWLNEIKLKSNPDIKIVLVGNKADLENQREVSYEEAEKLKDENGFLFYKEASAKSGLNSKEIFEEAAKILYEEYNNYLLKANNISYSIRVDETSLNSSKLRSFQEPKKKKKCCGNA